MYVLAGSSSPLLWDHVSVSFIRLNKSKVHLTSAVANNITFLLKLSLRGKGWISLVNLLNFLPIIGNNVLFR